MSNAEIKYWVEEKHPDVVFASWMWPSDENKQNGTMAAAKRVDENPICKEDGSWVAVKFESGATTTNALHLETDKNIPAELRHETDEGYHDFNAAYKTLLKRVKSTCPNFESKSDLGYGNSTFCPFCGAPSYQPLMGPLECSKGCKFTS